MGVDALAFLNDSTIIAATPNQGSTILISRDTGRTWSVDFATLTFDYPVMTALVRSTKDSFIAVGASTTTPGKGTIYWHDHVFNRYQNVDQPLYGVAMQDDSVAYAVGANGLIVTNAGAPLSIAGIDHLQAALKVYPNPASNSCTTELPVKHIVKVYDISGRLVWCSKSPALKQRLELGGKAGSVYLLEIVTEGAILSAKVVLH